MDVRPKDSHWPQELEPVAIIGAGQGGLALAEMALHFGHPTRIVDTKSQARQQAQDKVRRRLERLAQHGLLHEDADAFIEGLETTDSLEDATDGAGFVIEALPETLKLKRDAFRKLASMTDDAVMATATSMFSVGEVAEGNDAAERMVGTHFYDLGQPMPVVELIPGEQTSDETIRRAETFVRGLGKEYVTLGGDTPGFVITRVLSKLFHACAMAAEDQNPGEIDAGFRELGFPQGPFELMDSIGLDRVLEVGEELSGEVPSTIKNLVSENNLGRKTGQGWFDREGPPSDVEPVDPWPLMAPMLLEAAEVAESGFATPVQIDRLMRLGANVPGGPFQLVAEQGLEDVQQVLDDQDLDAGALDDIELPESGTRGIEVTTSSDITHIRFTRSWAGNNLDKDAIEAFASATWDVEGPLIITGEGRYFLHPDQARLPNEALDAVRKTESVAVLHGPLGDGAMSLGRACRRRVARVDAAIGIDRPVQATRAVMLELVDAVAHPLLIDQAVTSVLSSVTTVSERSVTRLLSGEGE